MKKRLPQLMALLMACTLLHGEDAVIEKILSEESAREQAEIETFAEGISKKSEIKISPEKPSSPKYPEATFRFQSIDLKGNTLLPKTIISKISEKYLNKAIGFEKIQELIGELTNAYVERGYSTTRVYLLEQDLKSGTLLLKVIEGSVQLQILENGVLRKGHDTAFPKMDGKPLQLRDIEQGLDQINRLERMDAKVGIEPGESAGESLLRVNVERKKFWNATFGYDNYGSGSTGEKVLDGKLGLEDIFGIYDDWQISHRSNRGMYGKRKWNRSTSFMGSIPFVKWKLIGSTSYFDYLTLTRAGGQTFESTGNTWTHRVELERLIHRNSRGKTLFGMGVIYRRVKGYLGNALINNQTRNLSVVFVKMSHTNRIFEGIISLAMKYLHGTKLFGCLRDSETAANSPRAQFSKLEFDLGYHRPFKIQNAQFWLRLTGHGQYSSQKLYSSERLSLGGNSTVRGFQNSQLTGDVGGYFRTELCWQPRVSSKHTKRVFGQPEFFTGFDIGKIKKGTTEGTLQGIAVGMRIKGKNNFADLTLSKALSAPSGISTAGGILAFRVGLKF